MQHKANQQPSELAKFTKDAGLHRTNRRDQPGGKAVLDPRTREEGWIRKQGHSPSKDNAVNIWEWRQAPGENDEAHEHLCKNDPLYDCAGEVKHIQFCWKLS